MDVPPKRLPPLSLLVGNALGAPPNRLLLDWAGVANAKVLVAWACGCRKRARFV
jgi:hypothetical protein